MEHIEISRIFLEVPKARKIKKKIMNAGFITQIDEVSEVKIGGADTFRIVLYTKDLIKPIEKILKEELNWTVKEV